MKKIKYIPQWRWGNSSYWWDGVLYGGTNPQARNYTRSSKCDVECLLHKWLRTHGEGLQVRCREELEE